MGAKYAAYKKLENACGDMDKEIEKASEEVAAMREELKNVPH